MQRLFAIMMKVQRLQDTGIYRLNKVLIPTPFAKSPQLALI